MNFIVTLDVVFRSKISIDDFSEKFLNLEENFLELDKNLEYNFSSEKITVYNLDFMNRKSITFYDYLEEGKILKKFLISENLATEENYKNFFKLEKIQENPSELLSEEKLDTMIARVNKNDPKLLDVLSQIEKIKKK